MGTMRNSVMLIGNAGADPEIRTFNNGQKVARVRIAINESYKNANNEWVQTTQWFGLVAYGNIADRVEKAIHKGVQFAIEGRLHNNEWNDDQGQRHSVTEIILNDLFLIDNQRKG
ncbi:MAG: single-stranded DNA-binding protein [Bacteroidales bacterium]|nr:single-stranded DNA-binding protein [Bacteroidales bacterium]